MKNFKYIFALLVTALAGLSLTACSNDDDLDTNQYIGGVSLNVYGPSPVMRGGQLRFLGSNLDQVREVIIPDGISVTNIDVVKSGVPSEIRITVPKDGPVPGLVTLITRNDQRIVTKTELNYEEGVEITAMTESAMPGDIVRIEGDYLNLIHSLAFADNVIVSENDFVTHDRYLIEVRVPEEAKTGKLELYTADLTVIDKSKVEYQIIQTEKALIVGTPTISSIASPRGQAEALGTIIAKAGEKLTINGTYFNVVADITIGGVSALDMSMKEDGTTLTFTLPAEAPDADIVLVCKSGIEVPVAALVTVKPSGCVASPNPVKAGQSLTITGQDMDVVASVLFSNVDDAVTNIQVAAGKVVVTVPEEALEGLFLCMANGETIDVPFTLVKPTVTKFDKATVSAGGELTIQGTNLDLVKTVQFGQSDIVEVSGNATTIKLTVPMNAQSGTPVLTLANGTTVDNVPSLEVSEAVFCYATELPDPEEEIKAGTSLTLTVANGDKLTGVQINGTDCQFVLIEGATKLIVGIPDNAGKGSKVRLISSNGEITYTIDFTPNTEVTTVLWTGAVDLGSWSFNWEMGKGTNGDNNPNMFKDMGLLEGDVIRVYVSPYNDWWNVKFYDGHWNAQDEAGIAAGVGSGPEINPSNYNLDEHGGAIEFTATAKMVEQLTTLTDWGYCWIVNGEGAVLTKITVTHYTPSEVIVWQGEAVADDWGNQPTFFSDGGAELLAAGLKVGSIIRIYITATSDAWNCQLWDGHWTGQFADCDFNNGNWNLAEHKGAVEFTVTDDIFSRMTATAGWGGAFLVNGDNVICTKITIE